MDGNQIKKIKKKQILTFFRDIGAKEARTKKKSLEKIQPYRFLLLLWLCCCDRPPPPTTSHHCFSLALSLSRIFKRFLKWAAENRFSRFSHECVFFFFSLTSLCLYMIRLLSYTSLRFFLSLSFVCMCLRVFSVLFLHSLFRAQYACLSVCVCVCKCCINQKGVCVCVCVFVFLLTCCYFSINPIN